jgi:hypothetical protein
LAVFVMFRQGSLWCRMARFNHSLGQRACDCERRGVEWIMVSSGAVMFGLSGCVLLRHRMTTTIVLARRPINAAVVASSQARWCTASRCAERRVVFWQNHTRAGTVPDQRGRCGLNCGVARPGVLRSVNAGWCSKGQVTAGSVYQPSSCRHGAGSTPAAWDAPWNGAAG